MKEIFVNTLMAGGTVDDIFVARKKQLAHKKDGNPYLMLSLVDRSGSVKAVLWDNVEAINKAFLEGDYIRIQGNVQKYREELQVVTRHIQKISPDEIDAMDFLPATQRDVEKMLTQLIRISKTGQNHHLLELLAAFFEDKDFVELFKTAPAAKKMHHAYLGGLLEHTLSVVRLIEAVSNHYKGVDKDLLIAGGIFHDIGKVHELSYDSCIDYSDSGRLLSHIVIGVEMVDKKISALDEFPQELALLLKHMIISHHGCREFGSPEPPKTLEAVILYHLDDLDAKVTGIRYFMEQDDTEAAWTSYHRILEQFFYKGKK